VRLWPERRSQADDAADQADAYAAALLAQGRSTPRRAPADPRATAAVQAAAGALSRALASADVSGTGLLGPDVLAAMGRDLVEEGETVWSVDYDPHRLVRAWQYTVTGRGPDMRYRLDLPGPTSSSVRDDPAHMVLHVRWASRRAEPWRGIPPWRLAETTATAYARVSSAISQEAGSPVAHLLPVATGDDAAIQRLADAIASARGRVVLVPNAPSFSGDSPRSIGEGWRPRRIGPEFSSELASLHAELARETAAACGLPPEMLESASARRESHLRYLRSTVRPMAAQIAAEASRVTGGPVTVELPELAADDALAAARLAQAQAAARPAQSP